MFSGALTALVTPFRDDRIDEKALRALVADQIANGIDGLVPAGTTGEAASLSAEEYSQLLRIVIDEARGRVPVIAGAGAASTAHSIELCKTAQRLKADGVLVVVPYYYKPTQEGLFAHYSAIAKAMPLPIVLYNIPGRCGVDLALSTLDRIASLESVVAIKEATGNVLRSSEIAARFGDRFSVLSGDDGLTLAIMAVGGQGVISVASNVAPSEVSKQVDLFCAGDLAGARAQHQRLLPLYEALFVESNPGIRLPFVLPTDASQQRIRSALAAVGMVLS
jgi:4-hydroxy-tetrahydrodipicolinate synthase